MDERGYGPDASRDERGTIEARVWIVGGRIALMHELPRQSPLSVNLMFDRLEALVGEWDRFAYVADLTDAGRPDAETRAVLKDRVNRVRPRVAHVAIVVGGNVIMHAMARLFAHTMGLVSVSTHATRAEAIEEAARVMGR